MRKRNLIWIAPLAILGMALFVFIGGQIVKALWNSLLPPLFGWHTVTFWQALGLLVLCRVLFGGWSSHGGGRSRMRERMRRRMDERYAQMTPEERERFRERMRARWGYEPSAGEAPGE
jgi:uncharacterized membrane protein